MPSKYLLRFGGAFERGSAAGGAKSGVCRDCICMNEQPTPEAELPTYSEEGVDLTLIRWMLSLTAEERILHLQSQAAGLQELRDAARRVRLSRSS